MRVTAQITEDVDTDKWAELFDTTDQRASDVRLDIKEYMHDAVRAQMIKDGLIKK